MESTRSQKARIQRLKSTDGAIVKNIEEAGVRAMPIVGHWFS